MKLYFVYEIATGQVQTKELSAIEPICPDGQACVESDGSDPRYVRVYDGVIVPWDAPDEE